MPTPRQHGGASLVTIPVQSPGFKGLNTQQASSILGPEWATVLKNAVLDSSGRLAARKGWDGSITTSAASAQITQIHEAEWGANDYSIIVGMSDGDVEQSTNKGISGDLFSFTDKTGTYAGTSDTMQFLNFNGAVYMITNKHNEDLYVMLTSAGSFDLANGGAGTGAAAAKGTVGLSAFGRLWVTTAQNKTIRYCALLDGTDWNGADAGVLDMTSVWPDGDRITALAAFNGNLVVFGSRHIAIYTDGQGSKLGINPNQMYLADMLHKVGCIARDSVVNVDGDIWFLSEQGVQSLARLIQEKSNPLYNLSQPVEDYLRQFVNACADLRDIRAAYSPKDRLYLLSLPLTVSSTEAGRAFAFDTRTGACTGEWDLVPRAMCVRVMPSLTTSNLNAEDPDAWPRFLMARYANSGEIGYYNDYNDDGTETYDFLYWSGWLDLTQGQSLTLIPKIMDVNALMDNDTNVQFLWSFDFSTTAQQRTLSFTDFAEAGLYNVGLFGVSLYGGGEQLREGRVNMAGTGEYIRLGIKATINGGLFSLQQLNSFIKIGRLK